MSFIKEQIIRRKINDTKKFQWYVLIHKYIKYTYVCVYV